MAKSSAAKRKIGASDARSRKAAKTGQAKGPARAPAKGPGANPSVDVEALTPPREPTILEPTSLNSVISEEELELTVDTLNTLAQHPGLIRSKQCRLLRTAAYEFRQVCTTGSAIAGNANLSARISAAFADENYVEARVLLAEMRIRKQGPKLGTLCRWVRDLDVISGLSQPAGVSRDTVIRTDHETELLRVLDAVLRSCGQVDNSPEARVQMASPVALQPMWNLGSSAEPLQVYASVLDRTIFESAPSSLASSLRAIETTPAQLRKPPNKYPAILYTSEPNSVTLSTEAPNITWHAHPSVPRLGIMKDVLSPTECKNIIAAGEHVTFVPDMPLREDGESSILAHNFYWVTDTAFHDILWARVAKFLPASIDGRLARGLNRRFRIYRYVPGAEYRCHIDGAWPPSGILPDDTYVYDASPVGKKQSSLFTFLMYLNDEFEGGETTFFLPAGREGTLNAYPVRPMMGAVAVFPHGEAEGALLHEGTGVTKGAKYIIRTDVEYDVEPQGA